MKLVSDKAQQSGKHVIKERWWAENGVEVINYPLPVGDYILADDKVQEMLDRKAKRGIEPKKMDFVGTYTVVVDTKRDMTEIEGNLVGKAHARFRDELILAQNNGIQLYVLVENTDGINTIQDVFKYTSQRRLRWLRYKKLHEEGRALHVVIPSKPPVSGEQLAKIMLTMEKRYGCKFVFCHPKQAGAKVLEILTQ